MNIALKTTIAILIISLGTSLSYGQTKVACIGNSITAGEYPQELKKLLGDKYTVQNSGQSGTKMCFSSGSPWVVWPGKTQFKYSQPNIVVIKLGTNDSQQGTWPTCKQNFKADYIKFIDSLYTWIKPKPKIYLCIPSPSSDNNGFGIKGSTIKNEIMPIIIEIGTQLNLSVIDLNTPLISKQKEYFPDGVHPTTEGAKAIAQLVYKAITDKPTGNENTYHSFSQFTLYPNPAKTELYITGNDSGNTTYEITSIEGKSIQKGEVNAGSISIETLKTGIYIIKIKTDAGERVQRFVKE